MIYDLPKSLEVCDTEYEIRSDFRAALDICIALNDPDLDDSDRGEAALTILYPDFEDMPPEHYDEAVNQLLWFINGGDDPPEKAPPKLIDWQQDFKLITAPVNRVLGQEIRAAEYLHWWTFLTAYYEIGDCLFAQVVRIREKQARGKGLDKSEQEFYRKNRDLVDLKIKYTLADDALMKQWGF